MSEDELRARVDALQARLTELENERRMWKSRAQACRTLIDAGIAQMLAWYGDHSSTADAVKQIAGIASRIEALEQDAWSRAAATAREFVRDVKSLYASDVARANETPLDVYVRRWVERFEEALR